MKQLIPRSLIFIFFLAAIFFLTSCENTQETSNKDADLSLGEKSSAVSLTIGWYLPLDYLQKIVGPDFTPRVFKSDTLGLMKLVITKSEQYAIKGAKQGKFSSAILLIAVDEPQGLFKSQPKNLDNAYVCPVTIVSESLPMARSFHDNGFVTEQSIVSLDISETEERINVEATISSGENKMIARCFFEDLPMDGSSKIMVINQTRPMYKYFYGSEKYNRYENGKGRIDAEGTTLLTSLGIHLIPYFFVLDRNINWAYSFE